jgi:hypothetical protein
MAIDTDYAWLEDKIEAITPIVLDTLALHLTEVTEENQRQIEERVGTQYYCKNLLENFPELESPTSPATTFTTAAYSTYIYCIVSAAATKVTYNNLCSLADLTNVPAKETTAGTYYMSGKLLFDIPAGASKKYGCLVLKLEEPVKNVVL